MEENVNIPSVEDMAQEPQPVENMTVEPEEDVEEFEVQGDPNQNREMSQEEMLREEIRIKEDEIVQDEKVLESVAKNTDAAKVYFGHMIEGKELELEDFGLRVKGLTAIQPRYEYETSPEYAEFQRKKIEYLVRTIKKQKKEYEDQQANQIKAINAQETKIKQDLPRLRKRIKAAKEELETLEKTKKEKPNYVG